MASVILRFSKQKGNPATKIEAHHERTKDEYKSNPDIDTSKSKNNIHLITPQMRYQAEIDKRIKESGCRVRKDSTRLVDTLITASPEFFWDMTHEKMVEYFQRAVEFMKGKIRPDMIFSAVIHLDEKTPHLHLCFVPLTDDNRLTAKEILGNRAKLSKWQDEFHEFMVKFYPDIERGTSASRSFTDVPLTRKTQELVLYIISVILYFVSLFWKQFKRLQNLCKALNPFLFICLQRRMQKAERKTSVL